MVGSTEVKCIINKWGSVEIFPFFKACDQLILTASQYFTKSEPCTSGINIHMEDGGVEKCLTVHQGWDSLIFRCCI